jgi:hypothetical protein
MKAFVVMAVFAAVCLAVSVSLRRPELKRQWRVRFITSGEWRYEENVDGRWSTSLTILQTGDDREPGEVFVYLSDAIRPRCAEIVGRVASEMKGYTVKDA